MDVNKIIILLLVTILSLTTICTSSHPDRTRKRDKSKTPQNANLCTMEDNSAAMHCVCVGGDPPMNTTSAECWIFTDGITSEHKIWSLFTTQPFIVQLKFFVRPQGQFTFIPTKGIRHLMQLKQLQITYANITNIHPFAMANLSSLTELILTRNKIVNLEKSAFAHLINLTELNLDENRIAEIRRDVFVNLPNLQRLFIANNNLSVIQEQAFRQLGHLLELELNHNYISVLTRDTFSGLVELKRLDFSYNRIGMLGDLTFSELWELEELNLEYNQIEFISERAFVGLNHLKKLILSNNQLTLLSGGWLADINTVLHLDLRSNNLETLTFDNIKPIIQNLKNETANFYIDGNKFLCDCRLVWIHQLHNETKNPIIRNTLEEMVCYVELPSDSPVSIQSTLISPTDQFDNDQNGNYRYDDTEYNDGDDYYLYDPQQDGTSNHVTPTELKDPRLRHFFEIPAYELICPNEKQPAETTLMATSKTYLNHLPELAAGISSNIASTIATYSITTVLSIIIMFNLLT